MVPNTEDVKKVTSVWGTFRKQPFIVILVEFTRTGYYLPYGTLDLPST